MALLTIGLPVYNGEPFLAACLDNLLGQTFEDFEIVIGDNASTDATRLVYERYLDHSSKRISVIRQPHNLGAAENFNILARQYRSKSKYFKWVAVDDLLHPAYLESCITALESDPQIVLCHSRTALIDTDGAPLQQEPGSQLYLTDYGKFRFGDAPFPLGTEPDIESRFRSVAVKMIRCFDIFGVVRSSALHGSSLFGPYYGCDRVMLIELAMKGRFHRIEEPFFLKREHAEQSSNLEDDESKQRWIDTSGRRNLPLVMPREIISRIMQSDLTTAEKIRCMTIYFKGANWGRLFNLKQEKTYNTT